MRRRTWQAINTDLRTKLAHNLRTFRDGEGFSVEEVVSRVPKLSSRHWQRIESGASTNVQIETLSKLAAALGVDPLDLLR